MAPGQSMSDGSSHERWLAVTVMRPGPEYGGTAPVSLPVPLGRAGVEDLSHPAPIHALASRCPPDRGGCDHARRRRREHGLRVVRGRWSGDPAPLRHGPRPLARHRGAHAIAVGSHERGRGRCDGPVKRADAATGRQDRQAGDRRRRPRAGYRQRDLTDAQRVAVAVLRLRRLPTDVGLAGYQCGGPLTDADVAASLDEIHNQSGATVVRTWFMQAYGGPGNWGQFDRVLAAAAVRGMKVIPVLTDQWAACEPLPSHYRSLAWYQSGYRQVDPGYTVSYRDYAAAIAAHYRNNPTIAFWQLVNEAEALDYSGGPCNEGAATAALRSFADDVTGVLKTNDPGHLVSLGTIGSGQCGTSSTADYLNVHAGLIDICEYHDYFGPGGLPGDQWHGVAVRINQCHSLNKPIFAGEVGLQASITASGSSGGAVTPATLAQRAAFFQQKLEAQFGAGVVGFLIWQYATGPRTDGFEVQPGDPSEAVMARVAAGLAHGGA